MEVQVWRLYVSEGVLAAAHGLFETITEYYIPELKLAINRHSYFKATSERYFCEDNTEFGGPPPVLLEKIKLQPDLVGEAQAMASGCEAYSNFKSKIFSEETC